jgi:signal transduction histidine kinase
MKHTKLGQLLPDASIRRKLVIGVALVHFMLMTIFVLDLVQRQRDFLWDELTRRTLHHAHVLAVSSSPWVLSDDLVGVEEVVQGSARGSDVRHAMIVDPTGRILAHTERDKIGLYLADSPSLAALGGEHAARVFQQSDTAIHVISPVLVADHLIGWSILAVDKSATLAYLAYVTRTGILYTLAAIAVGTVFAVLLSHSILRQLGHLLGGVDNLQRDVLDEPVKVVSSDEVGKVAQAFNHALASLADSRERLTAEVGERRRTEEALRTLSRRQVGAIEEERKRIARDLHDELGQALSGMQFRLKAMQSQTGAADPAIEEACARLSVEVERMGVSIHRIANDLRPATLDHLGLLSAIEAFVADQQPLVGERMAIAVDAAGFRKRLPIKVEVIAYRIVQEGLTNVVKHAKATSANVLLTVNHPNLIVTIRDNGIGMAGRPDEVNGHAGSHGVGLLGMQERAASIGGKVEIKPRKGGGTTLRAELPYGEEMHAQDQGADR